ncbi:oligosaccharide translocation protein RFT1 [Sphaerosporella brunnea]|uniref:Man(5)GlcNAc(2)-PP-dolichol translocation protein RFT1 n=1 Tax=Sphaerosporella brunnea TaxID=1250544 RepID=A0A5J5ERX1_9PEZI|nr:oligosaccharide translocation protein RFT1 [Sphaerosporella brunnea]
MVTKRSKTSPSKQTSTTSAPEPALSDSLLSASAESAKFLVLLQVASRLLTFSVNQLLLRYLSPTLLGVSVQLELLTTSILYFSRESLRNALQRQATAADSRVVTNLALLTLPLGLVFSVLLGTGYLWGREGGEGIGYWKVSVALFVIATLLELAAEPAFAVAQMRMRVKVRAAAESAAAMARCALTCGVTVWAAGQGRELGALPFAIGQIGYGGVLLLVYTVRIGREVKWGKIQQTKEHYYAGYFSQQLSHLAATMWLQSSIKHVLTQGDSLLVAWLTTLQEQGVYALANNYGSLVARMLFQPLEESSRTLFSKLLPAQPDTALRVMKTLLKLYLLLSVFFISLGPPFAPALLQLVAGRKWAGSAASQVLQAFCYYIPLLAVNGVTESFVQAVATPVQLRKQSAAMFAFSLGFAAAGVVFVRTLEMGATGLVWANAVNMLLRIVWSGAFIRAYFKERGVDLASVDVLPSVMLVVVGAAIATVVRGMGSLPPVESMGLVQLVITGASAGGALLLACVIAERRFLKECWDMIKAGQ